MSLFFGERWDAPMVDDATQVPTPVGQLCLDCQEPILDGERGVVTPVITLPDSDLIGRYPSQEVPGAGYGVVIAPQHLECHLRSSMSHIYGQCHCFVAHPSVRAEALATLDAINAQRAGQGLGPL